MLEEFLNKVCKLAYVKYQLDEDIILAYEDEVEQCYTNGFTPRRTVEVIAQEIFG